MPDPGGGWRGSAEGCSPFCPLASGALLAVFGGLWFVDTSPCFLTSFLAVHASIHIPAFSKDTICIGPRGLCCSSVTSSELIRPVMTFFQITSHSEAQGARI